MGWLRTTLSLLAIAIGLWLVFGFMAWNWDVQSWEPSGCGTLVFSWVVGGVILPVKQSMRRARRF